MANYYLRSSDGNDAAAGTPGATWATLEGALGQMSAGDTLYFSDAHSEYIDGHCYWILPGTPANPNRLLSIADWGAEDDPGKISHVLSPGAVCANGGGSRIMSWNGCFVSDGVTYTNGGAGSYCMMKFASIGTSIYVPQMQIFRNGTLNFSLHGYPQDVGGSYAPTGILVVFDRMTLNWRSVGNSWQCLRGTLEMRDCVFSGPGADTLFAYSYDVNANDAIIRMVNTDLSNMTGTLSNPNYAKVSRRILELYRCRLGSGLTLSGTYLSPGAGYVKLIECDHGANYVRQAKHDYNGTLTEDTVRVRDNSDSTYSHKLVSSANTKFYSPLRSFPVARLNVTEGSAITVRVDVLTDGVTLTDGEFWIEVNYLGSASYPLGSLASSAKADILAAASNLATSSEGWTTTDLSTPVKQYATVTFTPQKTGIIEITACLAKASTTVYVDPDATVS